MAISTVDIPKGKDVIRVQETILSGRALLDARIWYENNEGEHKPTKKGLCLSFESWQEVVEAIQNALSENKVDKEEDSGDTA